MPDFAARAKELTKAYDDLADTLQPIEITRVGPALEQLLDVRDSVLTGMQAVLTTDGTELLAEDYAAQVQRAFDQYVTPLSRVLDGLSDVTPGLTRWAEIATAQETRFLWAVRDLKLGEARDEMVQLHLKLHQMIRELEVKWASMTAEAKRLEELEARASAEMTAIVQKALHAGTDAVGRWGTALKQLLDVAAKVPALINDAIVYSATEFGVPKAVIDLYLTVKDAGKAALDVLAGQGIPTGDLNILATWMTKDPGGHATKAVLAQTSAELQAAVAALGFVQTFLPELQARYTEQITDYQRLLPNQGTVLVSLTQTRADVDTFLRTSGMDRLHEIYDKVLPGLDGWVAGAATEGMGTDASRWAKDVKDAFTERFSSMTYDFEAFVTANKGRFLGTVSRETEDELLYSDTWIDREQGLQGIGMHERLLEWRTTTIDVASTVATASSQVYEKLRYLQPDVLNQITPALNAYFDEFKLKLAAAADQASAGLAGAAEKVSDQQIHRDLDRSALRARLTA